MPARSTAQLPDRAPGYSLLQSSLDMSAAPLLVIPAMLEELGAQTSSVLRRAGIDRQSLSNADNRLAFDAVGRLLEECARATDCAHFGLLLGIRSGAASAGIASELMRHAETVGAGLRLVVAHLHLHDRGGVVALSARGARNMEFSYVIHHAQTPGARHILDASIAIACSIMRRLCGPQWVPAEVTFSHGRPRAVAPYRAFFRAPIRFDASHSAVVFPARDLKQPIAGADPDARSHLLRLATELDAARPASASELTVRALSRMVVAMPPTADRLGAVLGIKPRRLRERLEAEGSSVKVLLEDLRLELARQLLEDTRMPIGEVAATLHYSRPGAFSRAFKRWTGTTPRQCRMAGLRRASRTP